MNQVNNRLKLKNGGPPRNCLQLTSDEMYYKMFHKERGLALIFNHEHFNKDRNLSPRQGTRKDKDELCKVLTNLGFRVQDFDDPTYAIINKQLEEVAHHTDHSQYDCVLIAVMTHGDPGRLQARDVDYNVRNLWRYFTDDQCPTLAGKPKIFIIQACRGEKYDDGIILSSPPETDGGSVKSEHPNHPDFVIAQSAPPEYFSWRNTENGSWFIQSLCKTLKEDAYDRHLLTLLTMVCHEVAVEKESNTPDYKPSHGKKIVPSIYSTLTRLLIFNDKNNKKTTKDCICS